MNKRIKIYIVILVIIVIGVFILELSKPQPIDWNKTYNETHKSPYGTFILYDQLKILFPNSEIKNIRVTPYEYFDELYNWNDSTYNTSGVYIHISDMPDLDDVSAQELLDFSSYGNDVFISNNNLPNKILDSLNLIIKHRFIPNGKSTFSLSNPVFKTDSISFDKDLYSSYFNKIDSTTTTVLGYQQRDSIKDINFIKVQYGYGNVYLHLQPAVFTNYHLLKKDNHKYAAAVLSYLKNDTIHFDSNNKIGNELGESPLRFILKQPALRWAWYLGIISMLLFIIFNAKRKQRIVKILKPKTNTTIAFIKTIANLYYETKDHNTIIFKKITLFLEFIRREYYLDTQVLDDKFIKQLSLKSGIKYENTKELIHLIHELNSKDICNEADLLKLNKAIEAFYNI